MYEFAISFFARAAFVAEPQGKRVGSFGGGALLGGVSALFKCKLVHQADFGGVVLCGFQERLQGVEFAHLSAERACGKRQCEANNTQKTKYKRMKYMRTVHKRTG